MNDRANDYTVVIAVDARTLDQLSISLPTWRANRPELFERPWVVLYGNDMGENELAWLKYTVGNVRDYEWQTWPPQGVVDDYADQRERMLSSFIAGAARFVDTTFWLKIDTDVIAFPPPDGRPLFDPAWLAPCDCETWGGVDQQSIPARGVPSFVASRWGYTKNKDGRPWLTILDAWADNLACAGHPAFVGTSPLAIPETASQARVGHRRHCSWFAFYNTEWTRELAATLSPAHRMPVPSQDTTAHYFAARRRSPFILTSFKSRGLASFSRVRQLRAAAEMALSGKGATA